MGRIFLAEDQELGRRVAVKVLDDRFAGNEQLRQRFKREALTAARLSGHPHVITIFDVGESQGHPFIVMEYLPGGTLGERTRGEAVDPRQALAWLGQAADALDAAHQLGIVHRDVKPANLLFDERDELAVADFGIARIADDPASGMTATGTVLGTAGYLAPEQALGQGATAASDRYALGIVGYELLTGSRPFERGSDTAEAAAHINEPVPSASQRRSHLPPASTESSSRHSPRIRARVSPRAPRSSQPFATRSKGARRRPGFCPPLFPCAQLLRPAEGLRGSFRFSSPH
jgi:serine/threonine-protein kinase